MVQWHARGFPACYCRTRNSVIYEEGKLLSLQFWRDDKAIGQWRRQLDHRKAQTQGPYMFADYRLRIAEVVRDYGPKDRAQAPVD